MPRTAHSEICRFRAESGPQSNDAEMEKEWTRWENSSNGALCWNLYSVYGSYCLLKHSYIAPFLPLVLLSDLLSILQVYLLS